MERGERDNEDFVAHVTLQKRVNPRQPVANRFLFHYDPRIQAHSVRKPGRAWPDFGVGIEEQGTSHMGDTLVEDPTAGPVVGITRRHLAGLLAGVAALGGGLALGETEARRKKGKGKKKKKKTKVNPFKDIAITGDASETGDTFAGKLTISSFRYDGAQILAAGTLTGIVTKAGGTTESIAPQQVEFPYDGAGPGRQRDIAAQSGASGSLFVAIRAITLLLLSINFMLNGFSLQPALGKNKARIAATNEIMGASSPQAVVAGLNKLRGTYPA
jgi:hypothetical protein